MSDGIPRSLQVRPFALHLESRISVVRQIRGGVVSHALAKCGQLHCGHSFDLLLRRARHVDSLSLRAVRPLVTNTRFLLNDCVPDASMKSRGNCVTAEFIRCPRERYRLNETIGLGGKRGSRLESPAVSNRQTKVKTRTLSKDSERAAAPSVLRCALYFLPVNGANEALRVVHPPLVL
jgi:hypothetical protein